MSSFVVATTTVTFVVNMDNFTETYQTILRTWDCEIYLAAPTDYATLISLLSYPVTIRSCPGSAGITMTADIAGGAGQDTLTFDNVLGSPFTAALVHIERPSAYPGGGRRCRVTFQELP